MLNRLPLDPAPDSPGQAVSGIPLLGHRIAKVHDPGLARQTMENPSDQHGSCDRKGGEDNADTVPSDFSQRHRNCTQAPARPPVWKRQATQVASAPRKMTLGIECEGSNYSDFRQHLPQLALVKTLIGSWIHCKNERLPAKIKKMPRKFQRAQQAAAAALRRKVVGNNE